MYAYKESTEKPLAGQWSAKVGAKYTASFATISGEVSMKNWGLNDVANMYFAQVDQDPTKAAKAQELVAAYIEAYELKDGVFGGNDDYNKLSRRLVLGAKVSVENTTLIPGATLKLAWEGKDLANKYAKGVTKGTVAASCTIKF